MKRILLVLSILAPVLPASAEEIDQLNQLAQSEFRLFSEDLGAALSYKAVIPAEPLGIAGFDLGVSVTATQVENETIFNRAVSGGTVDTIYVPRVSLHKGLPLGFDVGAFYSAVPDSNINLWGAELRYALLEGGVASPAVGLRGTYSQLDGVDQLDFETRGVELTISKGFAFFTPYAGVGQTWVTSTPNVAGLSEEEFNLTKYYVGGNFNLGLVNLVLEGDRTGDATSYSAKFGLRF